MSLINNLASLNSIERSYIDRILIKTKNNHQLTERLLKKLLEELPEQIALSENYLKNQELEKAYMIIHKLHGSLSFCGFSEMQKLAANLEAHILANDKQSSLESFALLKQEISKFLNLKQKINF